MNLEFRNRYKTTPKKTVFFARVRDLSKFKILNSRSIFPQEKLRAGFTFIETLVAISILLIALVAPMSLAQDGIRGARLAQDQIVAFYLAQEGLEMVRNIRDQNKLNGNDILTGLSDCVVDPDSPTDTGCRMDSGDSGFGVSSCTGDCGPIGFYPYSGSGNTGVYGYGVAGYQDTKFSRDIRAWYKTPPNRNEAIIEVIIEWELSGTPQSYTVRNTLKDW